jgi:hypothetical protein
LSYRGVELPVNAKATNEASPREATPFRGITMRNIGIYDCAGGISLDGNSLTRIDGLDIGNTPTAVVLRNGAKIDLRNFKHHSSEKRDSAPNRNKKRRKRRG